MSKKSKIKIPGTKISFPSSDILIKGVLGSVIPLIGAGVGLFLSQITHISEDLTSNTVQNWVKRGLIEKPKGKVYSEEQVSRILIINSLRGVLDLNDIKFILEYINGDVKDKNSYLVSERELLDYYSIAIGTITNNFPIGTNSYEDVVDKVLENFIEKKEGEKERLKNGLSVIILAYYSAQLKKDANAIINKLKEHKEQ